MLNSLTSNLAFCQFKGPTKTPHRLYANIVKPYIGNDCSAFRLINSFVDEPQRCYLKVTPSILSCSTTAGPNTRHAAHQDHLLQTFFLTVCFVTRIHYLDYFFMAHEHPAWIPRSRLLLKKIMPCVFISHCSAPKWVGCVLYYNRISYAFFLFFFQQPMR